MLLEWAINLKVREQTILHKLKELSNNIKLFLDVYNPSTDNKR